MNSQLKILGIAGSLRKDSYHKAALRAAAGLMPEDTELEIFEELYAIPQFNQDDENSPTKVVEEFKEKIRSADSILFATPEYNYSVPGVLKNAIDWASRPYGDSAWDKKPAAIMSASFGNIGGARAQYHLRQIFIFLNMFPLNQPEVIIPMVQEKFDEKGQLIDLHTKEKITEMLLALTDWTIQLGLKDHPNEGREDHQYDNCYARSAV